MSKDLIYREDAIKALRCEYPWMPMSKSLREEWAIKTEGFRKAEEVIMELPSVDRPSATEIMNAYHEGVRKGIAEAYEAYGADRPPAEWIPATWQDENCPERLKKHKCSACGNRAEMVLVKTKLVDNYYCNKAEPITEYTHEEQLSNFCPNCGARMLVKSDENHE